MSNKFIYFDNAATGYPKPECVKKAVYQAFEKYGGNPGRSGHRLSVDASRAVYACREKVCEFLNFKYPERVVFTLNATHALNMAIKGLSAKGIHIIISNLEHNSVYRPVYSLSKDKDKDISFSVFDASSRNDETVVSNFKAEIRENTKLAVITVASNICGKILPVKRISSICKKKGIKLILDASQALGVTRLDFEELSPDAVCSAGHKGLYGPSGTGIAVFAQDALPEPIIQGGNGTFSQLPEMGQVLPEMLEAGTLNTVGICGLREGIDFVERLGVEYIESRCIEIDKYTSDELLNLGAVVYSNFANKTPITLFNIPKYRPETISSYLDENGICTRSGIHCSPLAHKALFTGEYGAVRVSPGYANDLKEAKKFINAVNMFKKHN